MFVFGHFLLIFQQGAQSSSKGLIFKRPKSLGVMLLENMQLPLLFWAHYFGRMRFMAELTDFDFRPVLKGSSIYMRPLKADDFDALYAAASDPNIWAQHSEPTRWQRDVFEHGFFKSAVESGSAFVVVDKANERIIGSSRFYEWDREKAEVAIGFTFLACDYWGGATNAEMKQLMLQHAFKWARLVWLHIGVDNWRSRKAAEKIGAEFSHEERKEINGRIRETAFYKILPLSNL